MATTPEAAPNANTEPYFNLEKIYTKDSSLEVPHAPKIFWSKTRRNSKRKSTLKSITSTATCMKCALVPRSPPRPKTK